MVESGTEKLTESLEEGGGFSPVSEPDGIGAVSAQLPTIIIPPPPPPPPPHLSHSIDCQLFQVVLRTDWIVETLNGGTRLSYFHER